MYHSVEFVMNFAFLQVRHDKCFISYVGLILQLVPYQEFSRPIKIILSTKGLVNAFLVTQKAQNDKNIFFSQKSSWYKMILLENFVREINSYTIRVP